MNIIRIPVIKDRIFFIAIAISIAWHIFWLSMVTVVSAPNKTGPIKFSKVSFLGSILGKQSLQLGVEPRERSFLEKRYMLFVNKYKGYIPDVNIGNEKRFIDKDFYYLSDGKLKESIAQALDSKKIEPPNNM